MGLTYTRAKTVAVGEKVTSTQYRSLARAFNDRLRNGPDCAYRVGQHTFNLFRQIRNPDESGYAFPTQAEFFEIYQAIPPSAQITWPVQPAGEAEGINLANPLGQFVYGIGNELDEQGRLTEDFWIQADGGAEANWELGKWQRGLIDPATGAQNWPAGETAASMFRFAFPYYSPMHKSYGGFFPTPEQTVTNLPFGGGTDCGSAEDTGLGVTNYEIKFTALRAGAALPLGHHGSASTVDGKTVITYAGSCPCGTEAHDTGHVVWVAELPFSYYVWVEVSGSACQYALDVYPIEDWIEGPYTGEGNLQRRDGLQISRTVWRYISSFRGTDAQRAGEFTIQQLAPDWTKFLSTQYALAPNRGKMVGQDLVSRYPTATWGGSTTIAAGTAGRFSGSTSHAYAAGFLCGGVFAKATGLTAATSLTVYSGTKAIATLALTPDENGNAAALRWLSTPTKPDPLRVELATDATFTSSAGTITFEATEQIEYKPRFWDAYLLVRLASTRGGSTIEQGVDGYGGDFTAGKTITDDLFRTGAILNRFNAAGPRDQADWINDSPIYETARQMSKCVRVLNRRQFTAYEVTGGKTVLRFRRFAYGMANSRVDLFDGMAPPLDPIASGSILEGETYVVRAPAGGSVVYRSQQIRDGGRFTASAVKVFQAHGDAQVYVYDGIKHAALKGGLSNEWILFLQSHCYSNSVSSAYKSDAFGDYFAWNNRCHWKNFYGNGTMLRHFCYNYRTSVTEDTFQPVRGSMGVAQTFVSPEAPSGYNYLFGSQPVSYVSDQFCKSCQIYQDPYEVESCVVDDWSTQQVIKITLKSRMQSHANAPATVDKDPSTWASGVVDDLNGIGASPEDYRTDDNLLREYVLSQVNPSKPCSYKTGDGAAYSAGPTEGVHGSCLPHFFFIQLIKEPYEDGNGTMEKHDSKIIAEEFVRMENYLHPMAEGFVDGQTSMAIVCETGSGNLFDFTFQNACFQAFGGRSVGAAALSVRPENPAGFGPLVNTPLWADVFNRLANTVNVLDRFRVELPVTFEVYYHYNHAIRTPGSDPLPDSCTTTGKMGAWRDGVCPPAATEPGYYPGGDEVAGPFYDPSVVARFDSGYAASCPFQEQSQKVASEFHLYPQTEYSEACPTWLAELLYGSPGLICTMTETTTYYRHRAGVPFAEATLCGSVPTAVFLDGLGYHAWDEVTSTESVCVMLSSGYLDVSPPPCSDWAIGHRSGDTGGICSFGSSHSIEAPAIGAFTPFVIVPLVDLS